MQLPFDIKIDKPYLVHIFTIDPAFTHIYIYNGIISCREGKTTGEKVIGDIIAFRKYADENCPSETYFYYSGVWSWSLYFKTNKWSTIIKSDKPLKNRDLVYKTP